MSAHSARLLRRAAQIVEERGWTQGQLTNLSGHVCAVGALDYAYYDTELSVPTSAYTAAGRELGDHVGCDRVWQWNDTPGRTAAEVVKAMNETADEVEFL